MKQNKSFLFKKGHFIAECKHFNVFLLVISFLFNHHNPAMRFGI